MITVTVPHQEKKEEKEPMSFDKFLENLFMMNEDQLKEFDKDAQEHIDKKDLNMPSSFDKWLEDELKKLNAKPKQPVDRPPFKPNPSHDPVNHPSHYTSGGIETIDFIEAKDLDFCLGNVVKYVARAGKKDDRIQDLKKARWYLDREIENLENGD